MSLGAVWTSHLYQIDRQTNRTTMSRASRDLPFREVIDLWQASNEFRTLFTAVLAESAFEAFFWETPPVVERTLSRPFEFVCVESASLAALKSDPSPFASQFSLRPSESVLTFPNLRGDAILVIPAPLADRACYTHLAKFLRDAPRPQVDAFWRNAGLAMRDRVSSAPICLSTAGTGVSWLHLGLDSRPKYYRYGPYKTNA